MLQGAFGLTYQFERTQVLGYECAQAFVLDRLSDTHAKILTGETPSWLKTFSDAIHEIYGTEPFQLSMMKNFWEMLNAVFGVHPSCDVTGKSEEKAMEAQIVAMEAFLDKLNNFSVRDIHALSGYRKFSRLYCLIFCRDTLLPIKQITVSVLCTLKTQQMELYLRNALTADDLESALFFRRKCDIIRENIKLLHLSLPPPEPRRESSIDEPCHDEMSPELKGVFAESQLSG